MIDLSMIIYLMKHPEKVEELSYLEPLGEEKFNALVNIQSVKLIEVIVPE